MSALARLLSAFLSRAHTRGRLAGTFARATLAAAATACLVFAVQAPAARPQARLQLADGTLSVANSRSGSAILSARDMRPGDVARGSVTIANSGSVPGEFSLASFGTTDTPGRGGGLLSSVLVATVSDVSDPGSPRSVYSGPVGAMPARPLGTFAAGEQRTYSFAVELPAAAAGLDSVQGGSLTVGYRWHAVGSTGTPTVDTPPPPTVDTPPPPTVVTPPPPAPTPPALKLSGPKRWSARSRKPPFVVATCSRACSLRATVRTPGLPRGVKVRVRSKAMPAARRNSRRFTVVLSGRARAHMRASAFKRRYQAIVVRVTASDASGVPVSRSRTIRVTR
jgi:hypothetical protein